MKRTEEDPRLIMSRGNVLALRVMEELKNRRFDE